MADVPVKSVNSKKPDAGGNVVLTFDDIGAGSGNAALVREKIGAASQADGEMGVNAMIALTALRVELDSLPKSGMTADKLVSLLMKALDAE